MEVDIDEVHATCDYARADRQASICQRAKRNANKLFSPYFMGEAIYDRLNKGYENLDRGILALVLGTARQLSRYKLRTGRDYIWPSKRRRDWIRQAAFDAFCHFLHNQFPEGLHERAARFGIAHKTYQKIRDPLAGFLQIAFATYRTALHSETIKLIAEERYPLQKAVINS
jgi:hypothetical protein